MFQSSFLESVGIRTRVWVSDSSSSALLSGWQSEICGRQDRVLLALCVTSVGRTCLKEWRWHNHQVRKLVIRPTRKQKRGYGMGSWGSQHRSLGTTRHFQHVTLSPFSSVWDPLVTMTCAKGWGLVMESTRMQHWTAGLSWAKGTNPRVNKRFKCYISGV